MLDFFRLFFDVGFEIEKEMENKIRISSLSFVSCLLPFYRNAINDPALA
jgi:hypothetical protein